MYYSIFDIINSRWIMRNTLKNSLPHIIGIILLIAITVVCYFAFIAEKGNDKIYVPSDNFTDTSYTDTSSKTSYVRTIPKQSKSSDSFLYFQDITGDGNTYLCNLFQTAVGNFLICESDCKNGDLQAEKRCVGIALCDNLANISQIYNIPSQQSLYYINSQITSAGIVVITTNAMKEVYYVNIISYELNNAASFLINKADNMIIYSTDDSFIIIAEYMEENIIYEYKNDKLSFSGSMPGSIVNMFEFGSNYTLFLNTANGYCITKINKNTLNTINETYINGYSLISVIPIMENQTPKYIFLETNGTVYARKMTKLDNSDSVGAKLGTFTVNSVCGGENKIVMVCSGRLNGMVNLNYDLVCEYVESSINYFVTDVLDYNFINGSYYYLTINTSNELLLISQKDNTLNCRKIASNCQKASFIFQPNNSIMITYQIVMNKMKKIEIIGIS